MNEPRLPDSWNHLRVPGPPAGLRERITGAPAPRRTQPKRRGVPVWPLLWAASMAGLVAANLWLDGRHRVPEPGFEAPATLAELRRGRDSAEALPF
jgi:hypothetical protein